jgi:hypothetical protein
LKIKTHKVPDLLLRKNDGFMFAYYTPRWALQAAQSAIYWGIVLIHVFVDQSYQVAIS